MTLNAACSPDSLPFSNLSCTYAVMASQSLPTVAASSGGVLPNLYSGVVAASSSPGTRPLLGPARLTR